MYMQQVRTDDHNFEPCDTRSAKDGPPATSSSCKPWKSDVRTSPPYLPGRIVAHTAEPQTRRPPGSSPTLCIPYLHVLYSTYGVQLRACSMYLHGLTHVLRISLR